MSYPTIETDALEILSHVCAWGAGNSDYCHEVPDDEPLLLVEAIAWPGMSPGVLTADGYRLHWFGSLPEELVHPGQCEGWPLCLVHFAQLLRLAARPDQSLVLSVSPLVAVQPDDADFGYRPGEDRPLNHEQRLWARY